MKISRRKLEPGVPSVAMADIAFNLVLFFIIMARAQDDSHLQWDPAKASQLARVENATVSITVDKATHEKESKIYLNGREVSSGQLAGNISNLLGNQPAGKRLVLLKIDKDTPAAKFEPIIEAVSEAGGDLVHVVNEDDRKE